METVVKPMQQINTNLHKKTHIETMQGMESLDLLSTIQWQTQVRKKKERGLSAD